VENDTLVTHFSKYFCRHPDKNQNNLEVANEEFRLVQQAYECLSDPQERTWYDEHRESILRGWTAQGDGGMANAEDMIFDVDDYMDATCFTTFHDDDEENFYSVYTEVFTKIAEGEISASPKISLDELEQLFPSNFGRSDSDYKSVVLPFYAAWDNFSTKMTFAWEDKYDTRDAEHRRIRKAMEAENQKHRRIARKDRNEDVLNLVAFIKKLDPRVKAYREKVELEKRKKVELEKKEAERKKIERQAAKEKWIEERRKEMEEEERVMMADSNSRGRFMFRLADEEEDFGKKKKGKKKNKKKKGKQGRWDSDDEKESNQHEKIHDQNQVQDETESIPSTDMETDQGNDDEVQNVKDEDVSMEVPQSPNPDAEMIDYSSEEESVESDDEPDVWRCDICRKQFKSQKQLENHLKSKKHKEMVKKNRKKTEKLGKGTKKVQKQQKAEQELVADAIEDLMNEFDDM